MKGNIGKRYFARCRKTQIKKLSCIFIPSTVICYRDHMQTKFRAGAVAQDTLCATTRTQPSPLSPAAPSPPNSGQHRMDGCRPCVLCHAAVQGRLPARGAAGQGARPAARPQPHHTPQPAPAGRVTHHLSATGHFPAAVLHRVTDQMAESPFCEIPPASIYVCVCGLEPFC